MRVRVGVRVRVRARVRVRVRVGGWVRVGVRVVHGACVALAPRSSLRLECISEVEASVDGHSAQRLIRVRGYGLGVRGEG